MRDNEVLNFLKTDLGRKVTKYLKDCHEVDSFLKTDLGKKVDVYYQDQYNELLEEAYAVASAEIRAEREKNACQYVGGSPGGPPPGCPPFPGGDPIKHVKMSGSIPLTSWTAGEPKSYRLPPKAKSAKKCMDSGYVAGVGMLVGTGLGLRGNAKQDEEVAKFLETEFGKKVLLAVVGEHEVIIQEAYEDAYRIILEEREKIKKLQEEISKLKGENEG